jgi:serine/threonine protein kinase
VEAVATAFPQLDRIELIGTGGMGAVYKARQPKLDRWVALKLLPVELGRDPTFAERFLREARVLARLSHPNIVAVHDFGQSGEFCYLLMEYVDGANLRQAMRAGRFSPAQALSLVPQICAALQFAHDGGVMHRDVKPENILLDARGQVKLADFGIAKLLGPPSGGPALTVTGATVGTPQYMAPEQIEHPGEVDHRADIYSLGVVFYELLTGELPLGRFAAPSSKTPLDSRVDDIVLRALAKERELRQQSANEMRTAVEEVGVPRNPPVPAGALPGPGSLNASAASAGESAKGSESRSEAPSIAPQRLAPLWDMPLRYRQWILGLVWAYLLLSLPSVLRSISMLERFLFPQSVAGSPLSGMWNAQALGIVFGVLVCLVAALRVIPRTELWLAPIRLRPGATATLLDRWLWGGLFVALIHFAFDSAIQTTFAIMTLVASSVRDFSVISLSTGFLVGCIYPLVLATAWKRGKSFAAQPGVHRDGPMPAWGMNLAAIQLAFSVAAPLLALLQRPYSASEDPPVAPMGIGAGILVFCLAWWTGSRFWLGAARVLTAFTALVSTVGLVFFVFWRIQLSGKGGMSEEESAFLLGNFFWILTAVVASAIVQIAAWVSLQRQETRHAFGLDVPPPKVTA